MIYYLLVASILSLLLVCFFYLRKVRVSKEINFFIVFFPSILSLGIIIYEFTIVEPIDTRYIDKRVRELKHYHSWSETIINVDSINKIEKKSKVTHDDYYSFTYLNDNGEKEERDLPKNTYEYFSKTWGKRPTSIIKDSLGRIVEIYRWNSNKGNRPILTYTMTEPYINYFKNTMELYNLNIISDKEAEKKELFKDYNPVITINSSNILEPRQSLVYGINLGDSIDRNINYLASMSPKFRPLLLVWVGVDKYNLKKNLIKDQRSYWKGGKDNEVIFCICINNIEDMRILWSGSFSWAEDDELERYVLDNSLIPGKKFDPIKYTDVVIDGYGKNLWKPRDLNNYSFCKMPLEDFNIVLIMLILIIVNVFISVKIVKRNSKIC